MGRDQAIRVCHLMSGDLWAGAEVSLYFLLRSMKEETGLDISVILLNEGKLTLKLRESGISTHVIDESRHGFWAIREKIIEHLRSRRVDIIHSHRYKENVLAATVRKKCEVKALVQTVHGTAEHFAGWKKLKARFYAALNNYYTKKRFDKILPVSQDIERQLAGIFPRERLVTIHNGVEIANIVPTRPAEEMRDELGINPNNPVIGTAGRMVPVKGYDMLLDAARIIIEHKPSVRFVLAGDGREKSALEERSKNMGLDSKVRFIGFRDDITDIVNCLDLFVMTSHHEGIPMILLEAMALQKPVVCTSVGGIREIIENEVSGLLVEPGNAQSFADACRRVLDDPELRMKLAIASKKRIKDEFSTRTQVKRLTAVYRDLMELS